MKTSVTREVPISFFRKSVYASLSFLMGMYVLLGIPLDSHAQNSSRMAKDLEVMERVLIELFKSAPKLSQNYRLNTRPVKAAYIEGYGILLYTPQFIASSWRQNSYNLRLQLNGNLSIEKEEEKDQQAQSSELETGIIKLMQTFLKSYGDLAPELKDQEHIKLIYQAHQSSLDILGLGGFLNQENEVQKARITAELSKEDLNSYRNGSIDGVGLSQAIRITKDTKSSSDAIEYKILGNILQDQIVDNRSHVVRLSSDPSEIVTLLNKGGKNDVGIEVLEDYGVLYSIEIPDFKLAIRNSPNNKGYFLDWDDEKADEQIEEKRDPLIDSTYLELKREIPRLMVEYGRTLRSLELQEMLTVMVDMVHCNSCNAPASMSFQVSKQVLVAFEEQRMGFDEAIANIQIKEYGQASALSPQKEEGLMLWDKN